MHLEKQDICLLGEINDDKNVHQDYNSSPKSDDCDRD
jgi:hypothetical protein